MNENDWRRLIGKVKSGRMSRRRFIEGMVGFGLTVPIAGHLLMRSGVANPKSKFNYKPTKRGGGGALKLLMWQAPTLLNPHFAIGTKDQYACRVFYEPLAGWDEDGNLIAQLATEIPAPKTAGVRRGGPSSPWKYKKKLTR